MVDVKAQEPKDQVLERWLSSIVKYGTRKNYESAFRAYTQYTKLTPSQMIDEAVEDGKKDPRQRRGNLVKRS